MQQLSVSRYIGVEVDEAREPQAVRDLILDHYSVRCLVKACASLNCYRLSGVIFANDRQ